MICRYTKIANYKFHLMLDTIEYCSVSYQLSERLLPQCLTNVILVPVVPIWVHWFLPSYKSLAHFVWQLGVGEGRCAFINYCHDVPTTGLLLNCVHHLSEKCNS